MDSNNVLELINESLESLSLYNLFKNEPGQKIADIFRHMSGLCEKSYTVSFSSQLYSELALWAEKSFWPRIGSLWQNFLLDNIIFAENTFTRMSSDKRLIRNDPFSESITAAAANDFKILQQLFNIDFTCICEAGSNDFHQQLLNKDITGSITEHLTWPPGQIIFELKKKLLLLPDWALAADLLADFHAGSGYGDFCGYHAFRWDGVERKLTGIADPDPVRLEELVGYESERGQIISNTERLLAGLPSGNMHLYGDRGTGKSSTVKALLHAYGSRGLRVIEISKNHLADYQNILLYTKTTRLKFVLFIDDLSFEDHETGYKFLKSILDGSLQAKPKNVAVYATSNRRHLVRENFDERQRDVNFNDTLQEKLSLSERFTTVLFLSPDQDLYLKIVENMARQRGLNMPQKELHIRALEWERWNNSRSGRTARQFVEHLISQP